MLRLRKTIPAVVAVLALGGVLVASTALAQDRAAGKEHSRFNGKEYRRFKARAADNTMRATREIFYDGKTIVVKTFRGKLVSVSGSKLSIEYLDGTTGDVETVGDVRVCAFGNPEGSLADLQPEKKIVVHTATNAPRGDITVVIQVSSLDELKRCKAIKEELKQRLGLPEAPPRESSSSEASPQS